MSGISITGNSGPGTSHVGPIRLFQELLKVKSSSTGKPVFTQQGVQILLDMVSAGIGSAESSIVWRPNGPTEGIFVGTWAEVINWIDNTEGTTRRIYMDGTLNGGTATIPAGTYNLDPTNTGTFISGFLTNTFPVPCVINLADGVVLQGLLGISNGIVLRGNSTATPHITVTSPTHLFLMDETSVIENAGTFPVIDVANGGFLLMSPRNGSNLNDLGVSEIVHVQAGGIMQVSVGKSSDVDDDTISGDVGSTLDVRSQDPHSLDSSGTVRFPTFANFLGTYNQRIDSEQAMINYVENNAPTLDNLGTAPNSAEDAMNEIKTGRGRRRIDDFSADVTLDSTHYWVTADANAGTVIITLPPIASVSNANYGHEYVIRRIDSNGANTVTVDADGAEQILAGSVLVGTLTLGPGGAARIVANSNLGYWVEAD